MGTRFVRLGSLTFELYTAPTCWRETAANTLIEHKTIEGKPRLEWVGEELRRIAFEVKLHRLYCDPGAFLAALDAMRRARKAWPLTHGDGRQDGEWALQSIERRIEQCDSEGAPLFVILRLGLIESPTPLALAPRGLQNLLKMGFSNAPRASAPGSAGGELLPAPGLVSLLRILR